MFVIEWYHTIHDYTMSSSLLFLSDQHILTSIELSELEHLEIMSWLKQKDTK